MSKGGFKSLLVRQKAQALAVTKYLLSKGFAFAKGSTAELRTQLDLANKVGLMSDGDFSTLDQQADEIARLLRGLINARSAHA